MKVQILNKSNNPLPEYKTEGSAGMDLQAFLDEPLTLEPLERALIPTGLFMAIEEGYEAQLRARSGLSIKHGITLINAIGTIDSDYRGEVKIAVVNLSNEAYTITPGERVCQMVINRYEKATLVEVETLEDTARGEGGFGSTGIKE